MKHLLSLILLLILPFFAQSQDCNKLGVWLWYIEITEFDTHQELADSIANMGIKRIYVKVADGSVNTDVWPELIDENVVQAYHNAGLEVWGWSYNYPNNSEAQAEALYIAAQTGYDGFVIDVEMEFDNKPNETGDLFEAFFNAREQAKTEGIIDEQFKIYCTTWGNPKDHQFPIDRIDPFVDGFMPQTYVEVWGTTYIENLTFWIDEGNREYEELGATKPIHHIAAMESGQMTGDQVNEFIEASGAETSVWRIPGGGTPLSIWNDWEDINWNFDFCNTTSTLDLKEEMVSVFPNPASNDLFIRGVHEMRSITISSMDGKVYSHITYPNNNIDVSSIPNGIYNMKITTQQDEYNTRFVIFH